MILFKRTITACFCFILFFILFYISICTVAGTIAGKIAGFQDPENAAAASELTSALFVQNNIFYIIGASVLLSLTSACWLSFWGILPWCKKKSAR